MGGGEGHREEVKPGSEKRLLRRGAGRAGVTGMTTEEIERLARQVVEAFDFWTETPDVWMGDDLLHALSALSEACAAAVEENEASEERAGWAAPG